MLRKPSRAPLRRSLRQASVLLRSKMPYVISACVASGQCPDDMKGHIEAGSRCRLGYCCTKVVLAMFLLSMLYLLHMRSARWSFYGHPSWSVRETSTQGCAMMTWTAGWTACNECRLDCPFFCQPAVEVWVVDPDPITPLKQGVYLKL